MAELQLRGQHPLRTINHADWYHISIQPCRIKSHCHWILPKSPTMAHRIRTRNTRIIFMIRFALDSTSDEWWVVSYISVSEAAMACTNLAYARGDEGRRRWWDSETMRIAPKKELSMVHCPLPSASNRVYEFMTSNSWASPTWERNVMDLHIQLIRDFDTSRPVAPDRKCSLCIG